MSGKRRWLSFIAGMLTGMLLIIALAMGVVYVGSSQTWLLRINTNGISDKVEGAAQLMAVEMLPSYIEDIKANIPELVTARVSNQFGDVKFQLGGEEFSLPEEFVGHLEENYRTSLISSINELLETLPLEEMGADLGMEVAGIVENSLYAEFNSRTVDIDVVNDILSVPVMIELVDQPGATDFQLQLYSVEAFAEH